LLPACSSTQQLPQHIPLLSLPMPILPAHANHSCSCPGMSKCTRHTRMHKCPPAACRSLQSVCARTISSPGSQCLRLQMALCSLALTPCNSPSCRCKALSIPWPHTARAPVDGSLQARCSHTLCDSHSWLVHARTLSFIMCFACASTVHIMAPYIACAFLPSWPPASPSYAPWRVHACTAGTRGQVARASCLVHGSVSPAS
jgi:hypothetical protein